MNLGSFIAKSAWRNPRRTILTVTSIAVSLAMIVVLRSIMIMFLDPAQPSEAVPRIVARHRVSLTLSLPVNYEQKIRKIDGVQELTTMNWFAGVYKDQDFKNFFPRFATDMEQYPKVYPEYSYEHFDDVLKERTACMVGDKLMTRYGWKIGDKIHIAGDIYPADLELTIRGVIHQKSTPIPAEILVFHKKYLDELLGETTRTGLYAILVRSPEEVTPVCEEIMETFRNSDAEVRAETEKAFQLSFAEMFGNIKLLFSSLISVVAFAIVLIAASTMAMAIRERTREIAVLKTLGFSRGTVTSMVVAEGMLVAFGGGVLGVGGSWVILPRPALFAGLGAGLVVLALLGLPLLLLSILLPEEVPGDYGKSTAASVRNFVVKFGPPLSIFLGLAVAAAVFFAKRGMDWFEFSGGKLPDLQVRPDTLVFGAILSLIIGVISSAIPAWSAARLRVLDGLRTIG